MLAVAHHGLLGPADPTPVEVLNPESRSQILLVCEHAGRAVPAALNGLGVTEEVLASHRGWDIGAADVARRLADALGAPLILQRYSRLVIDANRPPGSPTSIPEVSHGASVPANRGLTDAERETRVAQILRPMDTAIAEAFARHPRRAAISIHSFTPHLNGQDRPWQAGFLSRRDLPTAEHLMASLHRADPSLILAVNEPYRIEDDGDWFIPHHAEPRGVPHCLIEIRNDEIADDAGVAHWADRLAAALADRLEALP